ncbi:MAG: hypothetical protein E6J20_17180 [Chloroflexi bacterium]|nr:MAG: hypothetical protein E6J20_17180 [Chloroflexota bacterium]
MTKKTAGDYEREMFRSKYAVMSDATRGPKTVAPLGRAHLAKGCFIHTFFAADCDICEIADRPKPRRL